MSTLPKNLPMSSAPFVYNEDGSIAWNKMWNNFCYLAIEGGPSHRETLLKGKGNSNDFNNKNYKKNVQEVLRAYSTLVPYKAEEDDINYKGYIKLKLPFQNLAKWYQSIILTENVECKREGKFIYLPINDDFTVEKEVKNVVTVLAKAYHYWDLHKNLFQQIMILLTGRNF